MHTGLGATIGVATLGVARGRKQNKRHLGGAARILTPESKKHSETQLTSLMTVDQLEITDLSLIQLDTEGYERPILEGAERTIRAQCPIIVIEDNRDNCGPFLAGLGYERVGRLGGDTVYAVAGSVAEVAALVQPAARPGDAGGEDSEDSVDSEG